MGVDSDRLQVRPASVSPGQPKRLGGYLVDAGLLTIDQVKVALNDQQATGLRFGDVLVARGWVKEQTIEWVMEKVIIPEKQASRAQQPAPRRPSPTDTSTHTHAQDATLHQPRLVRVPPNPGTRQPIRTPVTAPDLDGPPSSGFAGRRDVPISKPLPSVKSGDEDVNWVG